MRATAAFMTPERWRSRWRWLGHDDIGVAHFDVGRVQFEGVKRAVRIDRVQRIQLQRAPFSWRPGAVIVLGGVAFWSLLIAWLASVTNWTTAEMMPLFVFSAASIVAPVTAGIFLDRRHWAVIEGQDEAGNVVQMRLHVRAGTPDMVAQIEAA